MTINRYCSTAMASGVLILAALGVSGQDLEAYRVYSAKGKQVDFTHLSKRVLKSDVVLFGEFHNNPICHWLQWELSERALKTGDSVVLGAEMFETDDQLVIDEYLHGLIGIDHLKKDAKLWPNFDTDYRPLLDLARDNRLPFIATNVPRRYASLVSKRGPAVLDSLSTEARALLPPLPFTVTANDPGYIDMREMMGLHNMGARIDDLIAAQALKDYTMAHNIFKHLPREGVFIHFNGSFHSQKHAGIFNYLKNNDPELDISVIAVVEDADLAFRDEWKLLGDYIIVIPSGMTKTH